jgi:hypothetical protein
LRQGGFRPNLGQFTTLFPEHAEGVLLFEAMPLSAVGAGKHSKKGTDDQ